ncbi:MAG: metallopeptidase family protein [Acidimicrobiia bacterium]
MDLVPRRRFETLVADALDAIPENLARQMDNIAVVVEDWPPDGEALLGLYEGVALTQRSPFSYGGVLPDRITIYRGPLCALAEDEEHLADEVYATVLHEVAHYFGITDERLGELGWD